MSESLKLRVAQLEWASQAAAGKLAGQLTRDELIEALSLSPRLQEQMGDRLEWFLKKARLRDLEKLYREEGDATHSRAAGRLRGVGWVDRIIRGKNRPFQQVDGEDGEPLFQHIPYAYFLPTTIANAAMAAQKRREPTVVEGYLMLFAWMEWLILSRPLLWAPTSPTPALLSVLVEAFGIGPEIHRNDPQRLSRLAARLPSWYAHRGGTERSRQILEETVGIPLGVELVHCDTHGERPRSPSLTEEVFACRSAQWWARRSTRPAEDAPPADEGTSMRIADGLLRYQGRDRSVPLVREDIAVSLENNQEFPVVLFRVLPLWASIRIIVLPTGD